MKYDEAVAQAKTGKGLILSYAGGRARRGMFTLHDNGIVTVRLFSTIIAAFQPEYVTFSRGGYDTVTTREAINALVPSGVAIYASTTDRIERPWGIEGVWTVYNGSGNSCPFEDGMAFRYDGSVHS